MIGDLIAEADLIAHLLPQRHLEFFRDAVGNATRRQPARLGVTDHPRDAPSQLQADLGQLGGLAGPGLPGHDHHLVFGNGLGDGLAPLRHRQLRILDSRYPGTPSRHQRGGGGDCFPHSR